MTHSDFSILLDRRIELIKQTLDSKSKEYSTDEDKLHNFKEASKVSGEHPAKCLQGFVLKHLVSYFDMLNQIQQGKKFDRKYLDEKFGDIINYFILQEAIFVEYGIVNLP